jgi:hypothetical protein
MLPAKQMPNAMRIIVTDMSKEDLLVMQKCRVCRERVAIGIMMDQHLYEHYNYCKYGHYEEFDLDDPNWPKCKNEGDNNDS